MSEQYELSDTRPGVTAAVPGARRDSQLHVAGMAAIHTRHHTCTCLFPAGQIAVVQVYGAESAEEARAAVRAAWQLCRYEVMDGDLSLGHTEPFSFWLDAMTTVGNTSLLRDAEEVWL